MQPILIIPTVLAFVLSACGAKETPTPDVQATAMAAAGTMIAETQAAMPTETPVPPTVAATETPQATPTIPPLPTSPLLPSPTTASTSGDDCNHPISLSHGEKFGVFKVNNKSKQLITVSFYLEKNLFADCGYYAFQLQANSSATITSLPIVSCYWISAISFGSSPFRNNAGKDICNGYSTDKFTVNITGTNPIGVVAP